MVFHAFLHRCVARRSAGLKRKPWSGLPGLKGAAPGAGGWAHSRSELRWAFHRRKLWGLIPSGNVKIAIGY